MKSRFALLSLSLYELSAAVVGGDASGEERLMRLPSGVIPFQTQSDTGLNTQKVSGGGPSIRDVCKVSTIFGLTTPLSTLFVTRLPYICILGTSLLICGHHL